MNKPRRGPQGLLKDRPCLTEAATILLETLAKRRKVFEFGAGGSTLWLAGIASSVVSVEDDAAWYEAVKADLAAAGISKVEMLHAPTTTMHTAIEGRGEFSVIYVDPMEQRARAHCIAASVKHVKPGGWLVADDYNFPMVKTQIDRLRGKWNVAIAAGTKVHPTRGVVVATSTAFCRRPG